MKILGRLRFRTSYGQNVLKHSLEVVHLAGIMATELEAGVKTAKRAALLHDLGKAMTHEVEGSHAIISAQLAKRYGESQAVVHAIEAHHYEVQPQTVEAVLLIAADAISASRPGARGESARELRQAPRGARGDRRAKKGVEKVYALQAGREIRVIVKPTEVDDDAAVLLSPRDRARDRGPARVPGPGQGDGHPREPGRRVREVGVRSVAALALVLAIAAAGCAGGDEAAETVDRDRADAHGRARRRSRRREIVEFGPPSPGSPAVTAAETIALRPAAWFLSGETATSSGSRTGAVELRRSRSSNDT